MAKGNTYRPCPRECGGRILTGEYRVFNVKSKEDGREVCTPCGVKENMGFLRASIQQKEL